jgi:hypothetical protein
LIFGESEIISEYPTIKIGSQTWMTENLDVEKFQNDDLILQSKDQFTWDLANEKKIPTWCFYKFNSSNALMGKVYNYYAVVDSRGLAPNGFHVATNEEWHALNSFSDDISIRSSFVKEGFLLNETEFDLTPLEQISYGPWWPFDKQNPLLFISCKEFGCWDGQLLEFCATGCLPSMGCYVRCIQD